MKKALVFDLDGTVLPKGEELTFLYFQTYLAAEFAIFQQEGYVLMLNTARKFEEIPLKHLFDQVGVHYIICNVGCDMFYRGAPLVQWQQRVSEFLPQSFSGSGWKEKVDRHLKDQIQREKTVTPFYQHYRCTLTEDTIAFLEKMVENSPYLLLSQGNRLKFLHKEVNKGAAFLYLKQQLEIEYTLGLGDNLIDTLFLKECDVWRMVTPGEETTALSKIRL